eukprot:2707308-Amphidinium_carterae.1
MKWPDQLSVLSPADAVFKRLRISFRSVLLMPPTSLHLKADNLFWQLSFVCGTFQQECMFKLVQPPNLKIAAANHGKLLCCKPKRLPSTSCISARR